MCSEHSRICLGRSGSISPYCELDSLYFDNSNYENNMHYSINKLLDEYPLDDEYEEVRIVCDNEDEFNSTLDALFEASDGKFKISGVSNNPMEIVIEEDPRKHYRTFDESMLMKSDGDE